MATALKISEPYEPKTPFHGLLIDFCPEARGTGVRLFARYGELLLRVEVPPGVAQRLASCRDDAASVLTDLVRGVVLTAIQIAELLDLPSCDDVPWAIHKIMDRVAYEEAIAAWRTSRV